MGDFASVHHRLVRQSIRHHLAREEELMRLLADAIALAKPKCRCRACRHLVRLARELGDET